MKFGRSWGRLGMKSNCETIKAEDFCFTVTDGTHDSPKAKEDGHYLITSKHLAPYNIDFSSAKRISDEDYQQVIKRSLVEQWDILFSMIGTIGITYLEKNTNIDYACKNMGIFKFNGDKDKAYWLYYYLQTPQAKEYILGHLRGTTQQYLPLGSLRDFPIQVPSTKIRNNITSILRSLDDRIAVNIAINENLESQAQAIFKSWFVDFEPFGGVMPEDMREVHLNELCEIVTKGTTPTTIGKHFSDKGINFLKAESILQNHSFDRNKFAHIDNDTHKVLKRSIIKEGDIVFTIAGTLGRFALVDNTIIPANTNQAVAIIRANKNVISSEYLYSFFIGNWHNEYYAKRVQQAVQANLSLATIKSLPIFVLSNKDMMRYNDLVTPICKAMKANEYENLCLSALRDTLLPKLMNGEIDVSKVKI